MDWNQSVVFVPLVQAVAEIQKKSLKFSHFSSILQWGKKSQILIPLLFGAPSFRTGGLFRLCQTTDGGRTTCYLSNEVGFP